VSDIFGFFKKYIWIILAGLILAISYNECLFWIHIRSELFITFLSVFIGLTFIRKIENDLKQREEAEKYWSKIKPVIVKSFRLNAYNILVEFLDIFLPDSTSNSQIAISSGRKRLNDITCSEMGNEFKRIAKELEDIKIKDYKNNKLNYSRDLVGYYENISLYLRDVQTNIVPVILIHSQNAENIDLFVEFNGDIIRIEAEIKKYKNKSNNDILGAFSKFFLDLNDICGSSICIAMS
jgi:hypothetical protein